MFANVEQKHWWVQFPFSWVVEFVLVIALLAVTAFATTQVRGRDATIGEQQATIAAQQAAVTSEGVAKNVAVTQREEFRAQLEQRLANQAAIIDQQAATIVRSEAQMLTLREVAALDAATIEASGQVQAQLMAAEQALRAGNTEAYEIALSGAEALQSRIADLTAQRHKRLVMPVGADT